MSNKTFFLLSSIIFVAGSSAIAQPRPTATPTSARPTSSPSQTPTRPLTTQPSNLTVAVPPTKIAIVDTEMFSDEKGGIFRLVDAARIVQNEFRAREQELQTMQTRLNTLVEDIRRLQQAKPVDQRSIQAKQDEGTRLAQEFETKKQRYDEDYAKRSREVTGPVSQQIGKALDEFASQHGITMTLDLSKLLPAILTAVPTVEITQAFIADFNRKNPRTAAAPATRQ